MTRPSNLYSLSDPSKAFINMVLYGYPGCGKTVMWGTGGERLLFMDSDIGTESASASKSAAKATPVRDYDDLQEAYDWLKHEALPAGEFDWVVWDSITLFQDRALIDDVLKTAAAANPRQDPHVASQREYLVNQNRISEFMRLFVDLPVNFGVSAHVLPAEDPEGNIIYMPAITGKNMASKISGYANVVAYMAVSEDGKRRIITDKKEHYFAKDRFHALRTNGKPFVDAPTVPKITDLVRNSMNTPTKTVPRRRRTTAASGSK
jgi:hypothetical protein